MTQFWLYAALLCLVAIGFVCWPRGRPRLIDREAANVALYRQRLDELDREHREGRLSDSELATLTAELSASLLLDADAIGVADAPAAQRNDRLVVLAAALLVPLIAFVGYRQLGSISDVELAKDTKTLTGGNAAPEGANPAHGGDLKALADKLATRLESKPEDADGWFLLGRTAVDLKQYQRAANAFAKVAAIVPTAPAPLIYQAQAQFMQYDRHVTPEVKATINRVLVMSPGEPSVLELLAVDAFERKDYRATLDYLNQGMGHEMPPEQRAYFQQGIAKARELLGEPPLPSTDLAAGAAPVAAADDNPLASGGPAIVVLVNVAPGVKIAPQTTIFVVAKAVAGPPMPLAVQRRTAADLPFKVRLDASSAMSPALTIASVDQVIVSARASRRGTPEHAPDDIEVASAPLHPGAAPVELTLTLGGKSGVVATQSKPDVSASIAGAMRPTPDLGAMANAVSASGPASASSSGPANVRGAASGTMLRVMVELGADVHVPPTTPVFVFAREASGPPMPVAVRRMTVADLPTIVLLDDSSAMQPNRNLSSVARVEIVARVANSGGVTPRRGDIEGRSAVVAPRTAKQVIPILVDRVLP